MSVRGFTDFHTSLLRVHFKYCCKIQTICKINPKKVLIWHDTAASCEFCLLGSYILQYSTTASRLEKVFMLAYDEMKYVVTLHLQFFTKVWEDSST